MRYVQFLKDQFQNFVNGVPREQVEETVIALRTPVAKAKKSQPQASDDPIFDDLRTPMVAERYTEADLRDFLNLYSSHTWTFRCANTIATAAATVDFVFKKGKDEIEEEDRSGFLKQPNFFQTWYDLFETTFLHLELAGNSFWEIQRQDKEIVNIFPLRPDRITIVPDAKKRVLQYEYNVNGEIIRYEPEEILHLKYADAKAEFWGIAPASAARNTITLDFYAIAWNKDFFNHGAEPGFVLETENTLTDMAFNRLQKLWGKRHRGKPHEFALLEEGLKYKAVTSNHADMQYLEGRDKNAEEIGGAYNVPPFFLGRDGGGPPNEQKKRLYQTNVIPKLTKLGKFLNAFLFSSQGVRIDFLTKSLPMIIEDEEIKARIAQSNVNHGIWTQNEARHIEWGMKPVAWGDTWWQSVGLFDTQKPETRPVQGGIAGDLPGNAGSGAGKSSGFNHPSQIPAPTSKGCTFESDGVDFEKADEIGMVPILKMEVREPDWADKQEVEDWQQFMFWKQLVGPDELELRRQFRGFFKGQGERILPRIAHLWPMHKAEESGDARKIAIVEILKLLFDEQLEENVLRSFMVPIAENSVRKYGQNLLTTKNIPIPFRMSDPNVRKFMEKYTASQVRHISETTRQILKDQLLKAADAGEPIKAVLARVRDAFDGNVSVARAQRIARTELVTMSNNARLLAAQQSGVLTQKRWISEKLPTTRQEKTGANHINMHGIQMAINQPFEVPNRKGGVDLMDVPGANSGSAENVCNCVCVASFSGNRDAFADLIAPPDEVPPDAKVIGKLADQIAALEKCNAELAEQLQTLLADAETEPEPDPEPPAPPAPPAPNVTNVTVNVAPSPAPNITNQIDVKPSDVKAPDVNVEVDVNPTPINVEVEAPDVHIDNHNQIDVEPAPVQVDKAAPQPVIVNVPAPIVTVEVHPEIKAPDVHVEVNPEIKIPATTEKTTIIRDPKTREIKGSIKEITPENPA